MSGFMDCSGLTDIGRKRPTNEDQFLISDVCKSMRVHQTSLALDHQTRLFGDTQGTLLLVADGMGGHEAGERASQLAIDGVVDYTLNRLGWFMLEGCETDEDFEDQLKEALISCQKKIDREVAAIPQRRGMGSTLTMAYIIWPKMFIVHVGDTRCYLLRDGKMQLLTRDHTLADLASEMDRSRQESEQMDEDEPAHEQRPFANVLWNVIGGDGDDPHPDALAIELAFGDALLLCSDGLSNHLNHRQISEVMRKDEGAAYLCQQLIDAANAAGGSDNITAIVCRFVDREKTTSMHEELEQPVSQSLEDTIEFETTPVVEAPAQTV